MLQACLVVLWLARAGLDRHQTWSWSYRCLVKHFIKLESFLPGFLVEKDIKDRIFLTWLSSLPSVVVVGASGESPLAQNNVSPSWHKIVENDCWKMLVLTFLCGERARCWRSSMWDPQQRPAILFCKKTKTFCLSINCGTCSPVFLSICSSILPPS